MVPPGYVAVACVKRSVYELGRPAYIRQRDPYSTNRRGGHVDAGVRSVIVLGDGRADHMGKEKTVRLSEQSTHAKTGKQVSAKSVSSTLL